MARTARAQLSDRWRISSRRSLHPNSYFNSEISSLMMMMAMVMIMMMMMKFVRLCVLFNTIQFISGRILKFCAVKHRTVSVRKASCLQWDSNPDPGMIKSRKCYNRSASQTRNSLWVSFLQWLHDDVTCKSLEDHWHTYQSLSCATAINTQFSELFPLKRIHAKYKNAFCHI